MFVRCSPTDKQSKPPQNSVNSDIKQRKANSHIRETRELLPKKVFDVDFVVQSKYLYETVGVCVKHFPLSRLRTGFK